MKVFHGKYRAIVTTINDPEKRGRIKVKCPKVYGGYESPWCLPCSPFAFDNAGFFAIPHLNETIWVEFEEGNPKTPIWVGSWWIPDKVPLDPAKYESEVDLQRILKTRSGHEIVMNDFSGQETIHILHAGGSKITMHPDGSITVQAVANLNLNAGGNVSIQATGSVNTTSGGGQTRTAGGNISDNAPQIHHN